MIILELDCTYSKERLKSVYNQELKNRFLKWKGSGTSTYQSLFRLIETFENSVQTDLSQMSLDMFRECVKYFKRPGMSGFVDLFRAAQHYIRWSAQDNGTTNPWIDNLDMYDEYIRAGVFFNILTWEDVYSELIQMYPLTEGHMIWPLVTFAWLGLDIEECCALKNEDVDIAHKRIYVDERVVSIQDPSQWKILNLYANTSQGVRTQNQTFLVESLDCGYFLKVFKTKNSEKEARQMNWKDVGSTFSAYGGKCRERCQEPKFAYTDIWRMGCYYQLAILEQKQPIEEVPIATIKKIFHVSGNVPTSKMLLTEYQLYKQKLSERRNATSGF